MVVAPADWRFESRLPWPGVRGRRLWHHITCGDALAAATDGEPDDSDDADERPPQLPAVRYEVEMCACTAGHIALVLLRRDAAASAGDPVRHASTPAVPNAAAAAAAQLAIPRVLYVVDAVPPKRATPMPPSVSSATSAPRSSHAEPRWTMLSSDVRAHSFGGTTAASEGAATPSLVFSSVQPHLHQVDELALIEELFTTSRATKDACILAKPPLLCARFDCRLISVEFSRHSGASGTNGSAPLRCIVAREDGMCYIWEWSADLHTWNFLNRFCFLENPNLKWTRPVLLFASTTCVALDAQVPNPSSEGSSGSAETIELTWWSAETKTEPKLFVRKVQFGVEKNTFRTEIRIGGVFEVPRSQDIVTLHSSSLGLWSISQSRGVRLRSTAILTALELDWKTLLLTQSDIEGDDSCLTCVHNVTGELLVFHRKSGDVFVVTLRKKIGSPHSLASKRLFCAAADYSDTEVQAMAAHRQLLLLLLDQNVGVYSLVSGELLVSLPLPTGSWSMEMPLTLWTSAVGANRAGSGTVGLFGKQGFWQLCTPSGHALAALHHASAVHPFQAARPYGPTLAFEAAEFALELLQSARALVGPAKAAAWGAAVQTLSSPALLLATLSRTSQSPIATHKLVDDMAELISSIYHVTHEILATGRFGAGVEKRDDPLLLRGLPFVTAANVEGLHHLANWALLAKRKLARLRGSVIHKGSRHIRSRTLSALTTFSKDGDEVEATSAMLDPLEVQGESSSQDDDASSSRLSRKLRPMTSLQFAAGSCSIRHGAQWLEQLESLLLPAPPLPPHALLFHEERSLADFQVALSSFSKHMYFESMCRLYLLHAPTQLLPFIDRIAQFAPRLFTLSGSQAVARSHVERALLLLPPARRLVHRVLQERGRPNTRTKPKTKSKRLRKHSASEDREAPSAQSTLLVYARLLCLCGSKLEACRVLLDAHLYEDCLAMLLVDPANKEDHERDVRTAVFFAALEYCVAHRSPGDLENLLDRKPRHVDPLLVMRALKQLLPLQPVTNDNPKRVVTVGSLRLALLRLLKEHRSKQESNADA